LVYIQDIQHSQVTSYVKIKEINMSSQLPSTNPTAYLGVRPTNPGNIWFRNRDPINSQDTNNYVPGDTWMNPVLNHIFMLMRDYNLPIGGKEAVWVPIYQGSGTTGIQQLQGDFGSVVSPVGGICEIEGDLSVSGIETEGILPNIIQVSAAEATTFGQRGTCSFNPSQFTVVGGYVSAVPGEGGILTLTGDNTTLPVSPSAGGNININGAASQGIETVGIPGSNEILITAAAATTTSLGVAKFNPTYFTTSLGNVTPKIATAAVPGVAGFNASDFAISGGGIVSLTGNNPVTPCFSAGKTVQANNITGNGTSYTIVFDQTFVNQGGSYNSATGTFTAPVAGNYFFAAGAVLDGGFGTPMYQATITITPSSGMTLLGTIYADTAPGFNANIAVYASGMIVLPALATVTVQVTGYGLAGNTAYLYGNGAGTSGKSLVNYFHGYLVC
jgi:hypothetical protein